MNRAGHFRGTRRTLALAALVAAHTLGAAQLASAYDRLSAIQYIERWWNDRNPDFHNYDVEGSGGGDCANFGSQVLIAGGIRFRPAGPWPTLEQGNSSVNSRVDDRGAVPSADDLRRSLVAFHGATLTDARPANLAPGDIVFLTDVPCGEGGSAFHTLVVKKIVNGTIFVASHSGNRAGEADGSTDPALDDRLDFAPSLADHPKAYLHIPDSPVSDNVQLEQDFQVRYHAFRKFVPETARLGLKDPIWEVAKDLPLHGGSVKLVAIYDTTIRESPPPTVTFGPTNPFNSAAFGGWIASQFRVPRDKWEATAEITDAVPDGQQTMLNDSFGPDGSRIDSDGDLALYNPGGDQRVTFTIDNTAPVAGSVTVVGITADGFVLSANPQLTVENVTDALSGVDLNLTKVYVNEVQLTPTTEVGLSWLGNDLKVNVKQNLPDGRKTVRIEISDVAGSVTVSSVTFGMRIRRLFYV